MDNIREHDKRLIGKIFEEIVGLQKVTIYDPEPRRRVEIHSFNRRIDTLPKVALALELTSTLLVLLELKMIFENLKNIYSFFKNRYAIHRYQFFHVHHVFSSHP